MFLGLQSYLCFPGVFCTLWSRQLSVLPFSFLGSNVNAFPDVACLEKLIHPLGFFPVFMFLRCLSEYPQAGLSCVSSDPRVSCANLTKAAISFSCGSRLCPSGLCDSLLLLIVSSARGWMGRLLDRDLQLSALDSIKLECGILYVNWLDGIPNGWDTFKPFSFLPWAITMLETLRIAPKE